MSVSVRIIIAVAAWLAWGTVAWGQDFPAPGTVRVDNLTNAGSVSCCPLPICPAAPRAWASAEYLLWWIGNGSSPALVTTGNPHDAVPGALGQPGTSVLFGNSLNYGSFSGLRATLGGWLDADESLGLEGSGFFLFRRSVSFSGASDASGNPPLYVPAFMTNRGTEGSFTVADPLFPLPSGANGNIFASSSSQLWGAEINGLRRLGCCGCLDVGLLAGFRYLDLRESIGLNGVINVPDPVTGATQFVVQDAFDTRNQFYGGQLGTRLAYRWGQFSTELTGKLALGVVHQVVDVSGQTAVSGPGAASFGLAPGTVPGGFFTQPSNIGQQTDNRFAVVPSAQLTLGWDITSQLRVTGGYDFLYWSSVVRPGNQIDRNQNSTQIGSGGVPGATSPASLFNRSDFFAHGLSFGLLFRF